MSVFATRIRRDVVSVTAGFVGSGHGYTPVYGLIRYRGPVPPLLVGLGLLWLPLRLAVYGSEHPIPSTLPPLPLHVRHAFCVSAVKACLTQLCPTCSNRTDPFTVFILYMFCGIT